MQGIGDLLKRIVRLTIVASLSPTAQHAFEQDEESRERR
jgi:hypothetical protein